MKKILLLFLLVSSFRCFAQIPQPQMLSMECIGGDGYNRVLPSVIKTADGGFIVPIETSSNPGSGTIDDYCTSSGKRYLYLKYNADGSVVEWSKCSPLGPYIFPQADGSFIFGSVASGLAGGWVYQISKTDAAGSVIWSKTYGQAASAILKCMVATNDGCYIMAGSTFYSDTDFTTHYGGWTEDDIGIIKVDSNGNKVWSKVIGGTSYDVVYSLLPTPGGGCYLLGKTYSNDNDCTGNHGVSDVYLAKIDGDGNILWHRDCGGSAAEGGSFLISNGKGGVLIGASTASSDHDVTHFIPPASDGEIWLIEIDSANNIVWDNCYGGGIGGCIANSVCKASDGSIWIAGLSYNKFGQIDAAYGHDDAWIVHTDSAGNFLNAKVLGSTQNDNGAMIYPLSNNNVIAGGFFGLADAVFVPLSECSVYKGTHANAFLSIFSPQDQTSVKDISHASGEVMVYPNPAKTLVTVEGEGKRNYKITITNVSGQVLYKGKFRGATSIQVDGWVKGAYLVDVTGEDGYKYEQQLLIQ